MLPVRHRTILNIYKLGVLSACMGRRRHLFCSSSCFNLFLCVCDGCAYCAPCENDVVVVVVVDVFFGVLILTILTVSHNETWEVPACVF